VASSGSEPAPPAPAGRAQGAWPRIGLPTYVETARWGVWDRPAALLPHSYIAAVIVAGGVPVMLPPVVAADGRGGEGAVDVAALRAVEGIDGLLLTGGADVEPHRYGDAPEPTTQAPRPDRDGWELALLDAALARDLPVLAICRGAQILDVAAGGTLHQHVPDLVGHTNHQPGGGVLGVTPVRLAPGSLAAQVLGPEVKVPCYHHQSIDGLGTGLVAVGWADDGTVEAIERPGRRFVLGVQWHPEDGDDLRLFTALVAAAGPAGPAAGEPV
jgi:gamma-glutamyl-gamma-aminobutyrate hydrolase PuuD